MQKKAVFHPKVIETLKQFPREVRRELGKAIWDLQLGYELRMPLSRPMPEVGSGVAELRVRDREGIFRTFYYTKSPRGILVFHAFKKTSQQTDKKDILLGRKRFKEVLEDEKIT